MSLPQLVCACMLLVATATLTEGTVTAGLCSKGDFAGEDDATCSGNDSLLHALQKRSASSTDPDEMQEMEGDEKFVGGNDVQELKEHEESAVGVGQPWKDKPWYKRWKQQKEERERKAQMEQATKERLEKSVKKKAPKKTTDTLYGTHSGTFKITTELTGSWTRLGKDEMAMGRVAVGKEYLWAISARGSTYYCKLPCTGGLKNVLAKVSHIAVGTDTVIATTPDNKIYERPADGSGRWNSVLGRAANVAIGNEYLWVVRTDGGLSYMPLKRDGQGKMVVSWKSDPGEAVEIAASNKSIIAIRRGGTIWERPIDASGEWKKVTGKANRVAASNNYYWALRDGRALFRCKLPCQKWEEKKTGGLFKEIAAGN